MGWHVWSSRTPPTVGTVKCAPTTVTTLPVRLTMIFPDLGCLDDDYTSLISGVVSVERSCHGKQWNASPFLLFSHTFAVKLSFQAECHCAVTLVTTMPCNVACVRVVLF